MALTKKIHVLYHFLKIKHNYCVLRKFVHWRIFLVNKGAKILTVLTSQLCFSLNIVNTYK